MSKIFNIAATLTSTLIISGCIVTKPLVNAQGAVTKFEDPVLSSNMRDEGHYVLLEKNIASGKWEVISIERARQPITNERQERVVFNKELTAYAPDYTHHKFQTYADQRNYGAKTAIMICDSKPLKVERYGPCNSAFADVFIPFGVIKSHAAGGMSSYAKREWEDPSRNKMRAVNSPVVVLIESGAFERLGITRSK